LAKTALSVGDVDRSDALYTEALSVAEGAGDRHYTAHALLGLGDVARQRGLLEIAQSRYREGLELCRQIGSQPGMASALQHLASIAFTFEDLERSDAYHHEALEITRRLNNRRGMAISLSGLGAAAIARQDVERGVRILGAAEHISGPSSSEFPMREHGVWRSGLQSAIAALGSETCDRLREEGRSMSLDAVLALTPDPGYGASPRGSAEWPSGA
jgi:tetratricopeptide (TPR) repeat protein